MYNNQIQRLLKVIQLMKLLKLIVELLFLEKQQREDFQKTEEMDLELPNTPENGLDVWQDITTELV